MQDEVFSNNQYAGILMRDDLVSMCRQYQSSFGYLPTSSGAPVAIGNACDVLAKWDLKENLTSRGAILFRRFFDALTGYPQSTAYAYSGTSAPYWSTPFSASDAVHTPAGLNTADSEVPAALGDAIQTMNAADQPLDVEVGKAQVADRNGVEIPISGGPGDPNGNFNAIYGPTDSHGVTHVNDGSSFVQVVTWNDGPCPDARTILTYSLSTDPTNPHFADQTALFSKKRWVTDRFCAGAVKAAPVHQVTHLVA